jgi:HSP20 family protein
MSLTKWTNPDVMFPAFSTVFDEFLGDFSGRAGGSLYKFVPAVNIMETENEFLLEVAAPGMNREAFNLHVDHKQLTVSASQQDENETKGKYARQEFNYKSFKRTFALPDFVDIDKIHANYEDGLLKIMVPKREEVKPRTIQIS